MADRKPKAKGVPPATAAPPRPEKSQGERFIEAAEEAGVTGENLEEALAKLSPPRNEFVARDLLRGLIADDLNDKDD